MRLPRSLSRLPFAAARTPVADAEPEPESEPEAGAAEPERQAEVEPEPARRPRVWNLWDLERLAEAMNGDSRAEERALLLLHMREFADPSGNLPLEFDPLVRDAFGAGLAGLVT